MNAQRRRENALLKAHGWRIYRGNNSHIVINNHDLLWELRTDVLRLIVSQAASALAISPKTP